MENQEQYKLQPILNDPDKRQVWVDRGMPADQIPNIYEPEKIPYETFGVEQLVDPFYQKSTHQHNKSDELVRAQVIDEPFLRKWWRAYHLLDELGFDLTKAFRFFPQRDMVLLQNRENERAVINTFVLARDYTSLQSSSTDTITDEKASDLGSETL